MRHREHLAQADRSIAECKNRIARQREIIATAYENGHPTDIPVSMLRALEENLRSFEKHRHLILDQLKNARVCGRARAMWLAMRARGRMRRSCKSGRAVQKSGRPTLPCSIQNILGLP